MCEDDAQPPVTAPYHTGTDDQQRVPPQIP